MDTLVILVARYAVFLSLAITAVVWLGLPRSRKWEFVATAIVGGAIALALARLGSTLYVDQRPFVAQHIAPLFPHGADNGFPSDHTLLAMFLAACVLFYSRTWAAVLASIALLVGLARVEAHVHRPIDIAGAIAIGLIAALLAWWPARRLTRRLAAPGADSAFAGARRVVPLPPIARVRAVGIPGFARTSPAMVKVPRALAGSSPRVSVILLLVFSLVLWVLESAGDLI